MNVLIISTFDIFGGAAKAAYRLHQGLNRIGINSFMLVKDKRSQDEKVLQITPQADNDAPIELKIFERITRNYINKNRTKISNGRFSLGYPGYDLTNTKILTYSDLVNIHWVDCFQSIESISSILKLGKPVAWTIHDQNSFTGGCHYSAGCTLYKKDCKPCPQLAEDPYNIAYYNLKNKVDLLRDKKITVISPSKWLANLASQSLVFRDSHVVTIPNSIDIGIFTPLDKGEAKRKSGISNQTITILTGVSGWKPNRKGFEELLSVMKDCSGNKKFKNLVDKNKLLLLCFGKPAAEFEQLNLPYKSFGYTDSEMELSDIYNAADIFLLPSLEDNLPNTMLEAMACATPVIAFNTGGMVDMIKDGITGRLVPLGNVKEFSKALLGLVFHPGIRNRMGEKSREVIEKNYKLEDQARKYVQLFSELLPPGYSTPQSICFQENQDCLIDKSFNHMMLPLRRRYSQQ